MTLGRAVRQTQQSLFIAYCRPQFTAFCRRNSQLIAARNSQLIDALRAHWALLLSLLAAAFVVTALLQLKRVARKDTRQPPSTPAHYATATTKNIVSCSPAQPDNNMFTRTGVVPGVCVCVVQPHCGGGLSSCR